MLNYLPELITIIVVHILGVMSPGPDFAIVTRTSLLYNRRSALLTALGVAIGIITHITYALVGVAFIIERSIILFSTVKLLGAAYLIYIGYKSLRVKKQIVTETTADIKIVKTLSAGQALRQGFITNALNPKAALYFLSVFTQVINPHTPTGVQALYGVVMIILTFAWFGSLALILTNEKIKKPFSKIQHGLEKCFGVILIALGIKVAVSK